MSATLRDYCSNIYINNADTANVFDEFCSRYNIMSSTSSVDLPTVAVELLEKCINKLKRGKAAGADRLVAQHVVHAASSLIIHLKLLFRYLYHTILYLMSSVLILLFQLLKVSLVILVCLTTIGRLHCLPSYPNCLRMFCLNCMVNIYIQRSPVWF